MVSAIDLSRKARDRIGPASWGGGAWQLPSCDVHAHVGSPSDLPLGVANVKRRVLAV